MTMLRTLRGFLAAALVWAALALPAGAQTSPNWTYRYVPTTAEWNTLFASKQDYLGAPPLLTTGGTMTGPLVTAASLTSAAGFNIPPGTAPTSPSNGDVWTTTAGFFARVNGVTYNMLSGSLVVGTTGITSGTSGRVLYDNAGVLGELTVTGSGSAVLSTSPTITMPLLAFGTGADSSITASSTNTGFNNSFNIANGGNAASSSTIASLTVVLSGGSNAYLQQYVQGGTPTAFITSGSGITGGLQISASAGNLTLVNSTTSFRIPATNGSSGNFLSTNGSGVTSWAAALSPSVTSLITVGFTYTPGNLGTVTTGTTTLACATGNYQFYTNGGAHTLAAPSSDCGIDVLVTNNGSAGAITFSGFTVGSLTGSTLTTTNTNKFIISVRRVNSVSTYSIYALQ